MRVGQPVVDRAGCGIVRVAKLLFGYVAGGPLEQVAKLLHAGKTDLLSKFISKKGRPFSAYLVAGTDGKVGFEFESKERSTKAAAKKETKEEKPKAGTGTLRGKTLSRKGE